MDNSQIAKILREIAGYLEMQEELVFKIRAYEKAALTIEELTEPVKDIYKKGGVKALTEIPGVGQGIAERLEELLKTGKLKYYEQLKKKAPVDLSELLAVESLGPKNIKKLYQKLGIKNLKDLEKAARKGKIRGLESFGEKSEAKILRAVEFLEKSGGRFLLGHITPLVREIESRFRKLKEIKKFVVCGSFRRRKETIGDIDILATAASEKAAGKIMEFFVNMPEVQEVMAHGPTKSMVRLKNSLDMDLRVVPEESYGAALNYFTGSKDHNVALRQLAIEKGLKLNEYGLFRGNRRVAGRTEEEIYEKLGLNYIEPELREMSGEIQAASVNKLPKLIGYGDLKGDLQVQTNWTDGADSIEVMAQAAIEVGLQYIAITDHTKRLAMTGGLDEKEVLKQGQEIDRLNQEFKNLKFKILKGTECDILKDGSMDLKDEVLAKLDVVGGSIHSYFNLPRAEQTKRIIKAMRNPHVDIIFHPNGRMINQRPAYELDWEEIIKVARETGAIIEIDAYPDRLDIWDELIRKCVEAGVKMSIDSDGHSKAHFSVLEYGIAQARRGWAEKKDIINAWPVEKMLSFLKDGRKKTK